MLTGDHNFVSVPKHLDEFVLLLKWYRATFTPSHFVWIFGFLVSFLSWFSAGLLNVLFIC